MHLADGQNLMNKVVRLIKRCFCVVLILALTGCIRPMKPLPSTEPSMAEQQARAKELALRNELIKKSLKAERIVVEKSKHLMTVYALNKPIATFQIALGQEPVGPKTCAGDNRTPEGIYTVIDHKADSNFYLALRLSYPSPKDITNAKKLNCKPGNNIMIHGLPKRFIKLGRAHREVDWTHGCIAVNNQEMDQLWTMVANGTTVEIRP
jgi:murein L,D-transpeptidase YafK